ncbi:hypothetical protein EVAR_77521_1 [Eumeta japonica]|uniref:Uncharacterized protein n=1 Tax=Eumeta variegata TaxID=151549 RepID=A0A4C1T7C1_EUMVA|nr:hypothetical protein EVAR_77521_1 [Eumeta japonica]
MTSSTAAHPVREGGAGGRTRERLRTPRRNAEALGARGLPNPGRAILADGGAGVEFLYSVATRPFLWALRVRRVNSRNGGGHRMNRRRRAGPYEARRTRTRARRRPHKATSNRLKRVRTESDVRGRC